jgi:hypothetical protein
MMILAVSAAVVTDSAGISEVKWTAFGYCLGSKQGREGQGRLQADSSSLFGMVDGQGSYERYMEKE